MYPLLKQWLIATYNLRSLKPRIQSLKNDILERSVDVSFLQEIWEKIDDINIQQEFEKMLELEGLQYFSNPRPKNSKGTSYDGVTLIINTTKF